MVPFIGFLFQDVQEIVFTFCDFEISVVSVELSLEGNVIVIDGMIIFDSFSFESRDRAFCTPAIQLKTPPIQIKSPAMWIGAAKLDGQFEFCSGF